MTLEQLQESIKLRIQSIDEIIEYNRKELAEKEMSVAETNFLRGYMAASEFNRKALSDILLGMD